MKRLSWLATLAFAATLTACGGGGGSTIPPPPPTGGFSVSSLKGQYAFSMSGSDTGGAYLARTGSFIADGAGNITSGMEDVVDLGAATPTAEVTFGASNYSVLANGRGVIVLKDSSGNGGLTLTMDLQSPSQGFLVHTDTGINATATSGSFNLQTTADFLATSFSGNYVFDFSGADSSGVNTSIIGNIAANGSGAITGGVIDTNDGTNGPSGPVALTLPGTFSLDPTYGATFGRGTAQFVGHTYAFYIVDATQIMFLQEDSLGGSSGNAVLQTGTIPTQNSGFTASFAYLVGGQSTAGPDAAVARFTADAAGGIGTISYDENNDGGAYHISQGTNISNATYAIDTTNAGSGRGTLTFTDSSHGTFQYVFYLISPTSGVIQDVRSGIVADGTLLAQTGSPFTLSGLAGNYIFNWNGVDLSSSTVENFGGQYVLASSASKNISGVVDGTILGASGFGGGSVNAFNDIGTQGTLTITPDGSANNAYQIVAGNPLGNTYNYQAYIVDANTVFLVATDNTRVLAGFVSRQSQ